MTSAIVIVRQKKIWASPACAIEMARRQEEEHGDPAEHSLQDDGAERGEAEPAHPARDSTRHVHTARMIVRNPTVLAISRWLCS